jgi:hypothetical protein
MSLLDLGEDVTFMPDEPLLGKGPNTIVYPGLYRGEVRRRTALAAR